jgi:hypothetical protein
VIENAGVMYRAVRNCTPDLEREADTANR